MGKIDINVNGVLAQDHLIVEIANELRDNAITSSRLENYNQTYVLGLYNQFVSARNNLNSSCSRLLQIRNMIVNATNSYANAESEIYQKILGDGIVAKTMGSLYRTTYLTGLAKMSDSRMKNLFTREEEEDYYICIQYNYANGSTMVQELFKDVRREYVGGKYNEDTQKMEQYGIAEQYIGSGFRESYTFENNDTLVIEELTDVKNFYDGGEKQGTTNESISGSSYDVKSEYIGKMNTVETVTKNEASKIVEKEGIDQTLTDWNVESSQHLYGGITGRRIIGKKTDVEYIKGENLVEDSDSWTQKREMTTKEAQLLTVQKAYASKDLVGGSLYTEEQFTVENVEATYHIKTDNAIHTIRQELKVGDGKIEGGGEATFVGKEGKPDITAIASAKMKLSLIEVEGSYTYTDLDGNEVISAGLDAGLLDASAGMSNKNIKGNVVEGSAEAKGVGVSGSVDADKLRQMKEEYMKKVSDDRRGWSRRRKIESICY